MLVTRPFEWAWVRVGNNILYYTNIYKKLLCIRTSLAPFILLFAWVRDSVIQRARQQTWNVATRTYLPLPHCENLLRLWTMFRCGIHNIQTLWSSAVCRLPSVQPAMPPPMGCMPTNQALTDTFHWALWAMKTGESKRNGTVRATGMEKRTKNVIWSDASRRLLLPSAFMSNLIKKISRKLFNIILWDARGAPKMVSRNLHVWNVRVHYNDIDRMFIVHTVDDIF